MRIAKLSARVVRSLGFYGEGFEPSSPNAPGGWEGERKGAGGYGDCERAPFNVGYEWFNTTGNFIVLDPEITELNSFFCC